MRNDQLSRILSELEDKEAQDFALFKLGHRQLQKVPTAFQWLEHSATSTKNIYNFCVQVAQMEDRRLAMRLVGALNHMFHEQGLKITALEKRVKELEDARVSGGLYR